MNSIISTTVRCLRCRRCLRAATSTGAGYGPTCRRLLAVAAAAVADGSPTQRDKAAELIADAALVPLRRSNVWKVVASDGEHTYLTAPTCCTCPSGLHGRTCYHRIAAGVLANAKRRVK